jgi:twitching motility protein PilT
MLRAGEPQRLDLPATGDATLRRLLGDLLDSAREARLARGETVEVERPARGGARFRIELRLLAAEGRPLEAHCVRVDAGGHGRSPRGRGPEAPLDSSATSSAAAVAQPATARATDRAADPRPPPLGAGGCSPGLLELLQRAVERRASDVHLSDATAPVLRVDGALHPLAAFEPVPLEELLAGLLDRAEFDRVRDGRARDLALSAPSIGCFRLNVYRARDGLAAAVRILPRTPPSLESLALSMPLDDVVDLPHGLVLVCGPTGSGKSTTIAALAERAVRRRPHLLISLEDPIEYDLGAAGGRGLVRQRQIGRDVVDFPTGLRDALREDPDLLLIGEMREPESIGLALTAAETGHLVLASLHTRSAVSAVERIADSYPPERQRQIRGQLADALRVVVSQRLLPRAEGPGRVVALEVLRVTHGVAAAIRERNCGAIRSAMQSARRDGMVPLERSLADLVRAGQVTRESAFVVANDPSALEQYLRG